MNAREQLRRYLEQRREMGETELVLDSMAVDEALRLIAGSASREEGSASREEGKTTQEARTVERPEGGSGDWRAALRATGAGPAAVGSSNVKPPPANNEPSVAGRPSSRVPLLSSPEPHPALDAIAKEIATCRLCRLYATATNPVPGEGNPNADLMCIGEAPGATEDETGRPFVGAAGQLLTKILAAINLTREEVFICNVLKHRPPGNRNPAPDEVTACSPYLVRQIEIVKPKVIIALGTFAAQTLLDTKLSIGKLRGQVHKYYGVPLVVTYHPAALLRNPAWKRPTWEDVQLARRILDSSSAGA